MKQVSNKIVATAFIILLIISLFKFIYYLIIFTINIVLLLKSIVKYIYIICLEKLEKFR